MNPTVFELLGAGRRRQAAHTAIVACGKLCDACAKISFKPLHQTGYTFRSDADPAVVREYEKQLFHFHHCCIACVKKASVAGCRLCALFLARLSINVNIEYENKLGSALSLPGAGVWVVLTQRNDGIVIATDGRSFAARSQQTNWESEFTFHYEKLAAKIDLVSLPSNLVEAYKWYPERVPVKERFGDSSAGLTNTLNIAKAWYETCHDSDWGHVSCRPSGAEMQTLPSRVIEVGTILNPRLRLFPTRGFFKEQYLTLSYCWGKAPQKIVLLKDPSLQMVWKHIGLPFRELSKTIQDAILVTRQLGFRYIWIDALCVVQNDADDKSREFAVMGDIYKRSAMTIAAAAGSTANSGLFVHRDPLGRRPCPVYVEPNPKGDDITIFAQLPAERIVETPLDSRGWVFQEDMLATRTLKFCSDGLRWSCASYWMSEANPSLQLYPTSRPHTVFREWLHQPDWKPSWHQALDMQRHFYEDWYEAVASYTDRDLTKPSDRLPALAGLAQLMKKIRGCTYIQGLWKEDLEYGVLWYVGTPLKPNPSADILLENEFYRVVPASGRNPVATQSPKTTQKRIDFMYQAGMTQAQVILLTLKMLSIQKIPEVRGIPSWSWASLHAASIRFLYSPSGLTAQGTPMAVCLKAYGDKVADLRNMTRSSVAARGHMVLIGALEQVVAISGKLAPPNNDYETESMSRGKWSASLVYRVGTFGVKDVLVGYTALDEDPGRSGLLGQTLKVLLMRDDSETPSGDDMYATSGYLKRRSMVPLALARNSAGMIVPNGKRRYTTALLLKHVGAIDDGVYRRVGLCQMHHWVWTEELRDPAKRQSMVVII